MSNERLSKLQKLILQILFEEGGEIGYLRQGKYHPHTEVRDVIYPRVLKLYSNKNKRSISASISRSISNLEIKGYVSVHRAYCGYANGLNLTSKAMRLVNDNDFSNCYQVPTPEPVNIKAVSKRISERSWGFNQCLKL